MWSAIAYVTSGVSLVAFICATIAWILKRKTDQTERIIKSAPEKQRGELVGKWLEFFDVDTKNLSRTDQTAVALEQIRSRAERFRISAAVIVAIAIICAVVAVVALVRKGQAAQIDDLSKGYDYRIAETVLLFDLTSRIPNFVALNRESQVVEDRFDIVIRAKPAAKEFFIRDGTNGSKLVGESISHPSGTIYEEINPALGILNNVKHLHKLTFPLSRFPVNEPVRVHTRWTYTGSLQNEDKEFVGYRVQYPTDSVTFGIRLPTYKPCRTVEVYILDGAKAPAKIEGAEPYASYDGLFIAYTIVNPQVTAAYLVSFTW